MAESSIINKRYITAGLVMCLLLGGCYSKEVARQDILGTWAGQDTGYQWCLKFLTNSRARLVTYMPTPVPDGEGAMLQGAKIENFDGTWDIQDGLRLKMFLKPTTVQMVVAGEVKGLENIGNTEDPMRYVTARESGYYLKSINDKEMNYRDMEDNNKWYESKRVAACPEIFLDNIDDADVEDWADKTVIPLSRDPSSSL